MKFQSAQIKKAWEIRKAAAAKFGCGVMEISWSLCIKQAMYGRSIVEQLIALGGKEWMSGEKHRIYFNNKIDFLNLEINRYGTGSVSSARMDGEKISNRSACRILDSLSQLSIYWDVNENCMRHYGSDALAEKIIENINGKLI